MTNQLAAAHDALEAVLVGAFAPEARVLRNPKGAQATQPKDVVTNVAQWVVLLDDLEPEVLAVLCGPTYDLRVVPRVAILFTGPEADRRAAYTQSTETLKAVLAADVTLGGAVEDARLDKPAPMDAPDHEWLAGGLALHVRMLFNAPTPAG